MGKSYGTRLSRVQESSSWQNGRKAREILMGDELSMIILLHHVACDKILSLTYHDDL